MSSSPKSRPWYRIRWFQKQDTPEERKLIFKLDLLIVPYVFLSYWVKYIDQANINNAYVGGLKEDLGFHGNELVRLQTLYVLGAVLGQIPFMYLFTRIPMFYLIPFLDVAWGIFTLLQYRVHTFAELAAYRFLVGWFEAAFFPAIHFIFGSWYRGDEIARRGGVFYVGLTLGTLTAGLIQAGASSRLDGVHGLAGWRWMYIICSIITIPVGILGLLVLPGTPAKPNRLVMKDHDLAIASARLRRAGHALEGKVTWHTFLKIAKNPRIWALLLLDIFFWNGSINTSSGGYLLWLKSLKRYSSARVNELGAISPALGIFYTLGICFASDLFLGPAWAITVAHVWNAIGLIILTIWDVPESATWFAFMTTYSAVAMSSVLYGWINSQLSYSPAERSVALVFANTLAQSTTAWTPLLVFKTVEAPRFKKGYPFVLANAVCLIILAHIIQYTIKRRRQSKSSALSDYEGDQDAASGSPLETSQQKSVPVSALPAP
ncbi:MFS general substrate transporter [Lophiostoma macrostomum CBS 122681]|uniref:MFS general substrate transporter n=1 Tax=Lophiostoma macrostomum CBS 122681 TaxID=1314788 RepID=A0A6A6TGT1_9PLEO|nr:MFS general substrate transporter [Lophiostoma macrostomum CBS 122681]